ncbi:MAG: hypothetical protein HY904_22430 [Deltaproteobacteria bacterium]|nr:hypothetical protein [Deltaproteobacteria bacterium]
MKRVAISFLLGTLALGCTGGGDDDDNGSSSGGSSSSSTGGSSGTSGGSSGTSGGSSGTSGGSSGTSGGSSGTSGGSSGTSGGSSGTSGGSSGTSGGSSGSTSGTPEQACTGAPTLQAGVNNGDTTGKVDGLVGCDIDTIFGSYTVGQDSLEQVWSLNITQASGVQLVLDAPFDGSVYIRQGADCPTATLFAQGCVDSGGTGDPETARIAVLEPGQYWVVVEAYSSTPGPDQAAYTLTLTLTPGGICLPDVLDDRTPPVGNSLADALGPIGTQRDDAGAPADVTLGLCGTDEDWFTFFTSGGDVTLHAIPPTGTAATMAVAVQSITRPATGGAPIAGTPVSGTLTNGVMTLAALPTGEYAMKISATGVPQTGVDYGFNILFTCDPDGAEFKADGFTPGNNSLAAAYRMNGTFTDDTGAPADQALNVCLGDEDFFSFPHSGGNLTVHAIVGAGATGTVDPKLLSVTRATDGTPTGTEVTTGVTVAAGILTATAPAAGEYAIKVSGTGQTTAGTAYDFNVIWACPPDDLEFKATGAQTNDTDVNGSGPLGAIDVADALTARLCDGDTDYLWINNRGATGDVVVTLGGGSALTVDAFLATVTDGKLMGASGSANATIAAAGADKTVTFAAAASGANFLVKVVQGTTAPPAAGLEYLVSIAMPPPANDTCANATALTLPAAGAAALRVTGTSVGATDDLARTTETCGSIPTSATPPEVFYSFTAPATAVALTVTTETEGDTLVYLIKGGCTGGTEVACNDDFGSASYGSQFTTTLEANAAYTLVVDSYRNGTDFTLVLSTATP